MHCMRLLSVPRVSKKATALSSPTSSPSTETAGTTFSYSHILFHINQVFVPNVNGCAGSKPDCRGAQLS